MQSNKLQIEYLPTDQLQMYDGNANIHTAHQIDQIAESIEEFDFSSPILAWHNEDGEAVIVAGHGRLMAARKLGIDELPVVFLDHMTDEQRRAFTIVENQLTRLSEFDMGILEVELENITSIDMSQFDFDIELDDDVFYEGDGEVEEDEVPEDAPLIVKRGDVWKLGRHRLMCGDSTDAAAIAVLMDGVKADMVFTDPPYALVGNSTGLGSATDDMLKPFFLAIFKNICKFTHDLMHVYVCCDWKSCNAILTEAKKTQLTEKSLIVWDKESIGLGSPYMSQYELIWFFENHKQKTMQAGKTEYKNRRNIKGKSNVWKYKRVQDREHNAQKPVELVAEALNNSCFENEIVLDLFGGSGSTLIACEQLNRTCYMMELDPQYCDIIIKRWEDFTGQKAVRIDG